jgi:hypothetical protein
MANSLAQKIRPTSDLFITSLFGDQQLGRDTTQLAGMIAENSILKHGIREQSAPSVARPCDECPVLLECILTEQRQLLELGTITTILAFRER